MPSESDYARRLLEEAHRTFAPHLSSLQEAVQSLRSHLAVSLDQLTPRLEAIQSIQMPEVDKIIAEAVAEAQKAEAQKAETRKRETAGTEIIANFARELHRQETQEEILNLLLDSAKHFAPRIALLVTRGGQVNGWASRGYSEETGYQIRKCSFSAAENPTVEQVLAGGERVVSVGNPREVKLNECLKTDPEGAWHLIPMRAMDHPVAIIVAADSGEETSDVSSLLVLVELSSLYLENLALRILNELGAHTAPPLAKAFEPPAPAPEPPAAAPMPPVTPAPAEPVSIPEPAIPEMPAVSAEAPVLVSPEEVPTEVITTEVPTEVIPTEQETEPSPLQPATTLEPPQPVIALGPPEPQVDAEVEALLETIGKPGPDATQATEVAASPAPVVVVEPPKPAAPPEIPKLSEEEKLHTDARRFARLLVSEIKLYNELRLHEGRNNGDIYLRLKRDIDRSRETYERRVPELVTRKFDYFNDEIIRILAENDPAKLGADYPGPRLEG